MTIRTIALLLVLPVTGGCYHYLPVAHEQLVPREYVRVIADSGFVMQARYFNSATTLPTCRLTRAEGTLERASADTVWLAHISFATPAEGEARECRLIGAGFTTLGAGPDLRVHASRFEWRRTRRTLIWSAAAAGFLYLYVLSINPPDVEGVP